MSRGSPHIAAATRRKIVDLKQLASSSEGLKKTLTLFDLCCVGIGCVVGAGVFIITGQAANKYAGPGLVFSFFLSSIACFFTGLSYAELAAALPSVGSSYLYSSVFLGDGAAWTVGICLALENLFASSAVAVGFSAAFSQLLYDATGVTVPYSVSNPLVGVDPITNAYFIVEPYAVNVIAVMLIFALALVLSFGTQESALMTSVAVVVKIGVLVIVICYGAYYSIVENDKFTENHTPFIPPVDKTTGAYGMWGIARGAAEVFFSYIGVDSVCTLSAESVNPTRDVPYAIVIVLSLCTVLYSLVTYFLTGMVNYKQLNVASPVTFALQYVGAPMSMLLIVDIGAVAGLLSVTAVGLLAQSRVLLSMAIDGHLPAWLGHVDERFRVPRASVAFCGAFAAALAGVLPLDVIGELVSMGTLIAFVAVNYALIVKWRDFPDMESPFKVPFGALCPVCGILSSLATAAVLPLSTMRNFLVCMFVSYVWYFFYRLRHHADEIDREWRREDEEELTRKTDIAHTLGRALEKMEKVIDEHCRRGTEGNDEMNGADDDLKKPETDVPVAIAMSATKTSVTAAAAE